MPFWYKVLKIGLADVAMADVNALTKEIILGHLKDIGNIRYVVLLKKYSLRDI